MRAICRSCAVVGDLRAIAHGPRAAARRQGQSAGPRGTVEGAAARLTLSDVLSMPTWPVPATDRWASAPDQ
jgi:hypothetical protein